MDEIRIAVVGLNRRGQYWLSLLKDIPGYRIIALCDLHERRCAEALAQLDNDSDVRTTVRYEDILADERIDAIALSVRTLQQGAMAAQALEAGKHVNSEVPAAHSIEDCWRIVLAAERSGKTYHLAEQLRYCGFVQAWQRMVSEGALGKVMFVEGQYFHYLPDHFHLEPGTGRYLHLDELPDHPGREPSVIQNMPPLHYLPHELSPLLKVLDDRIVQVVGMGTDSPSQVLPDVASSDFQIGLMKTAKGAVLRMATTFQLPGPHAAPDAPGCHWYHIKGTKGIVESPRDCGEAYVRWLDDGKMERPEPMDVGTVPADAPDEAKQSGHGGVDWYPHAMFRDHLLQGAPLDIDVYQAMDTAAPAILAADSIEQGSHPIAVPDFRPGLQRKAGEAPSGGG